MAAWGGLAEQIPEGTSQGTCRPSAWHPGSRLGSECLGLPYVLPRVLQVLRLQRQGSDLAEAGGRDGHAGQGTKGARLRRAVLSLWVPCRLLPRGQASRMDAPGVGAQAWVPSSLAALRREAGPRSGRGVRVLCSRV